MPTHAQKVRFGIFVIFGILALVGLLAVITSQKYLKKRDIYYIAFENVSVGGLEVGSPVKYLGLKVGNIENIHIDPEHINRIIITVALDKGTPIKADARADLVNIGITGLKMIEIRGGTDQAPLLKPGEYILAGTSITEQITGKAEVIAEKLETLLNNLNAFTANDKLDKLLVMADKVTASFENLNSLILENRTNITETIRLSKKVGSRLDSLTTEFNLIAASMRDILTSDTLHAILSNAGEISFKMKQANILGLIEKLGELVERTNKILARADLDLNQGSEAFRRSIFRLDETIANIQEVSRMLNQDPSILFRGAKFKNLPDKEVEE